MAVLERHDSFGIASCRKLKWLLVPILTAPNLAKRITFRRQVNDYSSTDNIDHFDKPYRHRLCSLNKETWRHSQTSLVLVIDALDECQREDDVRTILLLLLAEARCLGGIRLRVLVTSRPETPIRLGFREIPRVKTSGFCSPQYITIRVNGTATNAK